jgi:hypothetical protein
MKQKTPKTQVIFKAAIEAVYEGYVFLSLADKDTWNINGHKQSLQHYFSNLVAQKEKNEINTTLNIEGIDFLLRLTKQDDIWHVEITITDSNTLQMKELNEYTPVDWTTLSQKYAIELRFDSKIQEYVFVVNLKTPSETTITLGGPEKIKLYYLHLNNLFNMYSAALSGQNHLLITMATGSGKSFTQALWFLVMYLSKYNCVFCVPREDLKQQLKKDFERLLPGELMDQMALDPHLPPHQDGISDQAFYRILTHEELLSIITLMHPSIIMLMGPPKPSQNT